MRDPGNEIGFISVSSEERTLIDLSSTSLKIIQPSWEIDRCPGLPVHMYISDMFNKFQSFS